MAETPEQLLRHAERLYREGKRRQGAELLEQILMQEINYLGAWKLLYNQYGTGQSLEEFQRSFTARYYPSKLNELKTGPQSGSGGLSVTAAEPAQSSGERQGFSGLIKKVFRRGDGAAEAPSSPAGAEVQQPAAPPSEAATPPTAQPAIPSKLTLSERPTFSASRMHLHTEPVHLGDHLGASGTTGSQEKILVAVVDDMAQTRENIIRTLRFQDNIEIVGFGSTGAEAVQLAREKKPDVILMDVNMPDMDGIAATAAVVKQVPFVQVIILTVQDDVDYMRRAMQAGARDFLTKPPSIDDLYSAVQRAGEIAHKTRAKTPEIPTAQAHTGPFERGKIITVYSPKGGVGRTLVTTNLAFALHDEETPTAVIDGDLQFGDIMVFFNAQGKNTILDLAPRSAELDPDIVSEVMLTHSSGIKLLAAPRPEDAESITGEQFRSLLNYLSELYSYVLVDTSTELTDVTLAALDLSDLIVLVTTQEIPSLAGVTKFLELAPLLKIERNRLALVINQYDKRINVHPERIALNFHQEVAGVIPADSRAVLYAINSGVPIMADREARAKPVGQAFQALANSIRSQLGELT